VLTWSVAELARRSVAIPSATQVVSTPSKSKLMRSDNTPRVDRFEMVDVSPPAHADAAARVLLWKV
jgi:hypothetical protein